MCIWASITPANHNTDMTFTLNDTVVGNFEQAATHAGSTIVYNYNTPVYFNESLPSGTHNITVIGGLAGKESVILLDRIIYTYVSCQTICHDCSSDLFYCIERISRSNQVQKIHLGFQTRTWHRSRGHATGVLTH